MNTRIDGDKQNFLKYPKEFQQYSISIFILIQKVNSVINIFYYFTVTALFSKMYLS